MARAEPAALCYEAVDKSKAIKNANKRSERKSKILDMINTRTYGPDLRNLKEKIKLEND